MATLVPISDGPKRTLSHGGSSHGSNTNLDLHHHGEENTLDYRIRAVEKEGVAKGKK